MPLQYIKVDYANEKQGEDLVRLLNQYACDPMGGGEPLSDEVKATLVAGLSRTPSAISIICYDNHRAVGLLNAFEGYSTFTAAPLINIHDVYIEAEFRGQGILAQMFEELEKIADERQCCKITLEVLSNNDVAKAAYRKLGFRAYELSDGAGHAMFWQKKL